MWIGLLGIVVLTLIPLLRKGELSEQMKDGTIKIEDNAFDMSLNLQRELSNRLIGASANDYGKLLAIVSNDELSTLANQTVRDLLEWPMEINVGNQEYFAHLRIDSIHLERCNVY